MRVHRKVMVVLHGQTYACGSRCRHVQFEVSSETLWPWQRVGGAA